MKIFAVDTSGSSASVAMAIDRELVYEAYARSGVKHSRTIMESIERAFEAARADISDIDLLAVINGPGSFTGVRIGVCAARAMAHSRGIPLLGVDSLSALAIGAIGGAEIICPMIDARRGQVYSAAFIRAGEALERVREDTAASVTEAIDALPDGRDVLFVGDGASAYKNVIIGAIGSRARFAPPHANALRASSACAIAESRFAEAGDYKSVMPYYLRKPQAERERDARRGGDA